jgi:Pup amidohydrolase
LGKVESQVDKVAIVGLETEYGILIENNPTIDPASASQLFFNLWRPNYLTNWDFAAETPAQDARGLLNWRVANVTDTDSSPLIHVPVVEETNRVVNRAVDVSLIDRTNFSAMLANGARFYIDVAHPEYSTPECASLRDLIAADVAGQEFLARATAQVNLRLPEEQCLTLYRNNTDFHGASFGCHENYLMTSPAFTALFGNRQHRLFTFLVPFLVTRQIFCGAGKVGSEAGDPTDFQISQRADFIETVVGVQTVTRRPIVNTRDEPHADPKKFRRLHVILGDTNMAEPTTYLKVGVTRLIINMLEAGWTRLNLALEDPVSALRSISRDLTCREAKIRLEARGRRLTALDIQWKYLAEARRFLDRFESTTEQESVWAEWQAVLTALADDPSRLGRKVDWIIKRQVLEDQMAKRGIGWNSPIVKELDIKYHAIDPNRSIYYLMLRKNLLDRVVSEIEVSSRLASPPQDTRAILRMRLLAALGRDVQSVNWDSLQVYDSSKKRSVRFNLPDPTDSGPGFNRALHEAGDPLSIRMLELLGASDDLGEAEN